MNRIVFALAALVALFAVPTTSHATHCGGCRTHVRVVAPVAPRVSLHERLAKLRAERAATGAAFRASLAQIFARVPRPVVAAPVRTCAPVVVAPRAACVVHRAPRVVVAPAPRPVRVAAVGCHHRARCGR